MPRLAAALLAAILIAGAPLAARAAIISGTWNFTVNSWSNAVPLPVPTTGSATFSFDDTVINGAVPLTDFVTNFGATAGEFSIEPGLGMLLRFYGFSNGVVEVYYDLSAVPYFAQWYDDVAADARGLTGGFTPAAVPAPGALALFGVGLIGLGALRRTRRA